jgi:hypothetical protein
VFLKLILTSYSRVINKKIRLQNGLCTYDDLKYLLENLYFMKNIIRQINFLLKILSTCLVTLSYTLYTSFIAYLLITQLKCLVRRPNFEHTSNSSSIMLNESQEIVNKSSIQIIEYKMESFEDYDKIMSSNDNYLNNYQIENSTYFDELLKRFEGIYNNERHALGKSCQLQNLTNFLNYKPLILFF